MVKKKKPILHQELENIILKNHNLLNVPELNIKPKKTTKILYGSDFDVVNHRYKNLIPSNNNTLQFEKNTPTKDNMFKTFKYLLQPTKSQFDILLYF